MDLVTKKFNTKSAKCWETYLIKNKIYTETKVVIIQYIPSELFKMHKYFNNWIKHKLE